MRATIPAAVLAAFALLLGHPPAHAQGAVPPEEAVAEAESLIAAGDVAAAVPLLERAGRNWYPDADVRLGLLLLDGEGIERDVDRAVRHLRRAAQSNWMRVLYKRGHPEAQHALAEIYLSPDVGPFDLDAGYRLHKAAARAGHAASQLALARLYATDDGGPTDGAEAYRWAIIARGAHDAEVRSDAAALAAELRKSLGLGLAERIEREATRFEPLAAD